MLSVKPVGPRWGVVLPVGRLRSSMVDGHKAVCRAARMTRRQQACAGQHADDRQGGAVCTGSVPGYFR
jgi:hypothetical protein